MRINRNEVTCKAVYNSTICWLLSYCERHGNFPLGLEISYVLYKNINPFLNVKITLRLSPLEVLASENLEELLTALKP